MHQGTIEGASPRSSGFDRALLASYVFAIAASILIAPRDSDSLVGMLGPFVDAIPATQRLVGISAMPAKTIAWIVASIGFSPLVLWYAMRRIGFRPISASELKTLRRGSLMLCLFLLPWLFVTAWRPHMDRGGAWISAMGVSEPLLIVFGCMISLMYAVVLCLTAVVLFRSATRVP